MEFLNLIDLPALLSVICKLVRVASVPWAVAHPSTKNCPLGFHPSTKNCPLGFSYEFIFSLFAFIATSSI